MIEDGRWQAARVTRVLAVLLALGIAALVAGCGMSKHQAARRSDVAGVSFQQLLSAYKIPSESMAPTLRIGDRVLVKDLGKPDVSLKVGEIVVFHPPLGAEALQCGPHSHRVSYGGAACSAPMPREAEVKFIKRIVAGPGDWLYVKEGHVYVSTTGRYGTFKREADSYTRPCGGSPECNFPTPVQVTAGRWFMMGDNRGFSDDSRFWGPVPTSWILGVAQQEPPAREREIAEVRRHCELYRSRSDVRMIVLGPGTGERICQGIAKRLSRQGGRWAAGGAPTPKRIREICALESPTRKDAAVIVDGATGSGGRRSCVALDEQHWHPDQELAHAIQREVEK